MKTFRCSSCRTFHAEDEVVRSVAGKATGCAAGLALGAAADDVWAALALALVGAAVGHWIDTEVSPRCPLCGAVLKALIPAAFEV